MLLTEREGKELLAAAGVPVPKGALVSSAAEAGDAAESLDCEVVVKLQVRRGSRGKHGEVRFAESPAEAVKAFARVGGSTEGPKVLIEERIAAEGELYASVYFDPVAAEVMILCNSVGGVLVEESFAGGAALHSLRVSLQAPPARSALTDFASRVLGSGPTAQRLAEILSLLYDVFCARDAELVEVNPLVISEGDILTACDAKIVVDDAALFRQSELSSIHIEQDSVAVGLAAQGMHFIELGGSVGVVSPGAGLNMALVDWLSDVGLSARCFLDITGAGVADWEALFSGAYPEQFAAALRSALYYLYDSGTRAFLINVCSGGSPVDGRAAAIADVLGDHRFQDCAVICHVAGNGQERAWATLDDAGIARVATLGAAVDWLRAVVAP